MNFDIIIGNPPYNNDLYLDFVQAGYEMLKDDGVMVMITPAKGLNGKGGEKNELFRSNIGPHTETICFYPCAQEIFDIRNLDGIAYYVVHKDKTFEKKHIINRSSRVKLFNNEADREIGGQLNNVAYNIIKKLGSFTPINVITDRPVFGLMDNDGKSSGEYELMAGERSLGFVNKSDVTRNINIVDCYKLSMNTMNGNAYYGNDGRTVGMNKIYLYTDKQLMSDHYLGLLHGTKDEMISAKSYLDTRLMRFILLTSIISQNLSDVAGWRFVPDPGAFDHIFTDAELYAKYGLTQEEINIIESVIKERK